MIILSTSTSSNFQLLLTQTVILLPEPQITEIWIGDLWMGKVAIKHPKKKLFLGPMKKKTKINLKKMLQQNNSREDSPKAKKSIYEGGDSEDEGGANGNAGNGTNGA